MTAAYRPVPGPARCSRVFPGEAVQVRKARSFAARALAGCPCTARETLLTCLSELAANAIEHTASGAGGVFTVEVVRPADGVAYVAVVDDGGPGEPVPRPRHDLDEGGRGLPLVAACASRWGYQRAGKGRVVWAEVTWPVAVRDRAASVSSDAGTWPGQWAGTQAPSGAA